MLFHARYVHICLPFGMVSIIVNFIGNTQLDSGMLIEDSRSVLLC